MSFERTAGGRQEGGGRGSQLTPFGQKMREIRRDKGLLLFNMAKIAGVSSGFLSLVETGKKPIPERLVPTIVAGLDLSKDIEQELIEAAAMSAREYKIQLEAGAPPLHRQLAHAMQTGFAKMSEKKKADILRRLLEEG